MTSAPFSQSAAADVEGRVVRTDHHALLAAVGVRPGWAEEWCWSPRKTSCPGRTARWASPTPGGQHELLRAQLHRLAVALYGDPPLLGRLVVAGAERAGVGPVVQLHHPGVGLEPVGDLVLGGEHRPVVRELDVGQVVVPVRVVQAERLVPAAPLVAGPRVLVDHDRRDVELPQPRAQRDAALPAAHDQDVGLGGVAQLPGLPLAAVQPGLPVAVDAVLGPLGPAVPDRLLVAGELVEGGQQRPGPAVGEPEVPSAAAHRRLELDPRLVDPVGAGRGLGGPEVPRVRRLQGGLEQVADAVRPLGGGDVPAEGDQVAPEARRREQLDRTVDVPGGERRLELRQPAGDPGARVLVVGGRGGRVQGLGHRAAPASSEEWSPRRGAGCS